MHCHNPSGMRTHKKLSKQREVSRNPTKEAGMEVMYSVSCGMDVHKKIIVCCLMRGRRKEIREFGASTRELIELASWLKENGCEMAAMESAASYWKPLYNILEAEGIPAMVVNAQHIKALPGRKTDTLDAEWIADLLRHGLLRASYIPGRPQRELRELLAYRKSLVVDAASEQNRIQKMLEGGNIKISGTISSIIGKSGIHLLSCIINGEAVAAEDIRRMIAEGVISSRLKATPEELADDLNGVLTPVQRKMIGICLEHIEYLNKRIDEIDSIIDDNLSADMQELVELLTEIPGVGENSAKTILSVIGTDMSRFPTAAHLASWAGVCPGNNESAGKRRSGKTRRGNSLLRTTLVLCAQGTSRGEGILLRGPVLKADDKKREEQGEDGSRTLFADCDLLHHKGPRPIPGSGRGLLQQVQY